ncbi:alpha beta-hydrolase [Mycena albidolilacea]|uniref:Alpha beta-hydrolase n=1 Tax=Mycena albidolilacea TaxID=1033008 RepID=A0AAD7F5W2_9AGAR|nr:alpha beta-hydrolase [Mycena albidolilacea]
MFPAIFAFLLVTLSCLSEALEQGLGTLHRRAYFYVGQAYTAQGNLTIAADQLYVEHLTPAKVTQPVPLYIVDQVARGRSPWQSSLDGALTSFDTTTIQAIITSVEQFQLWPQAVLHTQWPGNGTAGDPVSDQFYASTVPSLDSQDEEAVKIKNAGSQWHCGSPVILLTHSQGGQFGWILTDSRPKQGKAIVALEPTGPPFINAVFPPFIPARLYGLTDIPITYDSPITSASDITTAVVGEIPGVACIQQAKPARKFINIIDIPVLADNCTVKYLREADVSVEHISLSEQGIHGNGHIFFMEKNNIQIARVIEPWISKISR